MTTAWNGPSSSARIGELHELRDEVTVVIPTLNEAEAIGELIEEIKTCGYRKIVVVDGYSQDRTREIAESLGARVVGQHGKGKAGAVLTAREIVDTPFLVIMDGDHSYDPADLDKFIPFMENYDHIIGSRPRSSPNMSRIHRLGNWVLTTAFNVLMGSGIPDACSGMYMLRTKKVRDFFLERPGFVVDQEIAAQSLIHGRLTSVPIAYRARIGKAKAPTWRQGFRALYTIFELARTYNPMLMVSTIASLAIIPALIILIYTAILNYFYSEFRWGLALLGSMLLLFAGQGMIVSTLAFQIRRLERWLQQITGESSG